MRYEEYEEDLIQEQTLGMKISYFTGLTMLALSVVAALVAIWTATWTTWGATALVLLVVGTVLWAAGKVEN